VLLGLLLTLPVVSLLGALLASADPVFSQQLQRLLQVFNLEKLGEYLFRLFYISILAYFLSGVLLYALFSSREEKLSGGRRDGPAGGLGWLEAGIILASVDLLFASSCGAKFRYFFGGQANIHLEGFTYAEYARRGFNELVAVADQPAALSRAERRHRRGPACLPPVLRARRCPGPPGGRDPGPAFQRLLYEAAYGFSACAPIRIF
jgi:hypothetical protein